MLPTVLNTLPQLIKYRYVTCTCTMMELLSSAACNVHIFPEVVQPVFKRFDGRRVHDMLREFIPCVDHSLAEEMFSDIQV